MTETLWDQLSAPTPKEEIKWREGPRGRQLAYVDARYVMDILDRVCGPENWQCKYDWSDGKRLVCTIGIRVSGTGEWIWKADGAGETDIEGEKGAFSDAFKRAAVRFGVGRDLYHLQSQKAAGATTAPKPVPTVVPAPVRASTPPQNAKSAITADPPAAAFLISSVTSKEVPTGTLYTITTRDGQKFTTFDKKKGESAQAAADMSLPCKIAWTEVVKGSVTYRNLTALIVMEEHPEAPPADVEAIVDLFPDSEISR
jgi:hypothetical protein